MNLSKNSVKGGRESGSKTMHLRTDMNLSVELAC